jgi:hypothetical protein
MLLDQGCGGLARVTEEVIEAGETRACIGSLASGPGAAA